MIPNLSLQDIKEYAENIKKGTHNSTHKSGHLRDLEDLVNEMCQVRGGSLTSLLCDCHGKELQPEINMTVCGSHSRSSYGKTTISLAELSEIIESLPPCSCNYISTYDCICVSRCDCVSNCDCNCDYCACNCNYCGCNCAYSPPSPG